VADALKVELGGGTRPKPGFVNVDLCETADVRLDLDRDRLPFEDGSVDELYTSHCLEHLTNVPHVVREIARVCREGATVEIRVPSWLSDQALCPGHRCTISPTQVRHWEEFAADWFNGPRRLKLVKTEYVPSAAFAEAQKLFAWLTDEQVMRFVPGACHEIRYQLTVVPNEEAQPCA
jgi:SAM-dependent methyltransferase